MNIDSRNTKKKIEGLNICKEARELLTKFPKKDLLVYPTPVHRLKNLEKIIERVPIWIKRDDMTGIGIGGNKIRNLEYLLGDAVENNCDTVICSGRNQSNLVSLTAAAARSAGLRCISVHNDEKPQKLIGNMLLNHIFGSDTIFIGEVNEDERNKKVEEISKTLSSNGKNPYIIYNGSSTPLGILGYVEAAIELYEQILENDIDIKHVFIPAGNGGVAGGFIFGTGLIGVPFHVHVISVENTKSVLYKILTDFKKELSILIDVKLQYEIEEIMTIYEDYMGEGWGIPTEEADAMIFEFARLEGILVEKVYTSKTLVGMIDILKSDIIPKNEGACFIHTGGMGALFAQY